VHEIVTLFLRDWLRTLHNYVGLRLADVLLVAVLLRYDATDVLHVLVDLFSLQVMDHAENRSDLMLGFL
jgi:hypothetical protein